MKQETKLRSVYLFLFSLVSALFYIVGFVMILIDDKFINGGQYIITATVSMVALFLFAKNHKVLCFLNPFFHFGFLFSIIGLASPFGPDLRIGLWTLGIAFFLAGLFKNS